MCKLQILSGGVKFDPYSVHHFFSIINKLQELAESIFRPCRPVAVLVAVGKSVSSR
jgi:hypothetical protein